MSSKTSSSDVVRAWAVDNGYPDMAGKRGRIKNEVIEKFNEANKAAPYATGGKETTVKVTAMVENSKGGKTPRTRQVVVSEVRTAALDAGVKVSPSGRLPDSVMEAFVAGTLSGLATDTTV